jgi:putative tricarboxylic transport membrane protein
MKILLNLFNSLRNAIVTAAMLLGMAATIASAADWKPDRPIEIISGVAAGGSLDLAARSVQKILQEKRNLGQPINVVNRPGSGSAIAWAYLNTHPGNAHYLSMTTNALVINSIIGSSTLTYTDISPIAHLSREDLVFTVRGDSSLKSGRDLVERLKKDPGSLTFGIATSLGNPAHIAIAQVARAAGIDVRPLKVVVFNASTQAMANVLGGQLDVMVSSPGNPMPHVQSGKMRALAASAPVRLPGAYASAPTWKELGINSVSRFWRGVIGPKGLTPAQVAFWESEFAWLAATDDWKKYLADNLLIAEFMNARDATRFLQSESTEYRALLTELGLAKKEP